MTNLSKQSAIPILTGAILTSDRLPKQGDQFPRHIFTGLGDRFPLNIPKNEWPILETECNPHLTGTILTSDRFLKQGDQFPRHVVTGFPLNTPKNRWPIPKTGDQFPKSNHRTRCAMPWMSLNYVTNSSTRVTNSHQTKCPASKSRYLKLLNTTNMGRDNWDVVTPNNLLHDRHDIRNPVKSRD